MPLVTKQREEDILQAGEGENMLIDELKKGDEHRKEL